MPNPVEWTQLVVQGGALALLAWLVTRTGPDLVNQFEQWNLHQQKATEKLIGTLQDGFRERNALLAAELNRHTLMLEELLRRTPHDPS